MITTIIKNIKSLLIFSNNIFLCENILYNNICLSPKDIKNFNKSIIVS